MMGVMPMAEPSIYNNMTTGQSSHQRVRSQQQHQQQQSAADRHDGQRYPAHYAPAGYSSATSQGATAAVSSPYYQPSLALASAAMNFEGGQHNGDYSNMKSMPAEYSFTSASVPYPTPGIDGSSPAQQWLGNKRPLPTPMQNQALPSLSATFGMEGPGYQAPTHTTSFNGMAGNANFGGYPSSTNPFASTSAMTSASMAWAGNKPYSYPSAAYPYPQMQMAGYPGLNRMGGYSYRLPLHDRPFKCDQCVQSFNRNHDLKRHRRIHLAVKPFPCLHCDKSFSRKDALKRHILVKGCGGGSKFSQNESNNGLEQRSTKSSENLASDGNMYNPRNGSSLPPMDQSSSSQYRQMNGTPQMAPQMAYSNGGQPYAQHAFSTSS